MRLYMLRGVALTVLGVAALSQPLSLLCDVHCAAMASAPAPTAHLRPGREETRLQCCSEPQAAVDSPALPQGKFPTVVAAPSSLLRAGAGLADGFRSARPLENHT